MANSGNFQTNKYSIRGLQFNWSVNRQDIAGNYTVIDWNFTGYGGGSTWYYTRNGYLDINGSRVWTQPSNSSVQLSDGTVLASGQATIYHNSDGTKRFGASGGAGIYNVAVNCTGSGEWDLPTIPRYANITSFSVSKIDETSVRYNWSADATCDYAWYSKDNGNSWSALPVNNIITGLSPNTTYNFKLRLRRTDSQLTTDSGTYTQSTYDYPKPAVINDFTIGNAVTINVNNPLNRSYKLELISNNNGAVIGEYEGNINGNVTGFNNSGQKDRQYASIPNSDRGTYYAKITYGSSVKTLGNATYYINASECTPTFSNFTYKDSNTNVTNVTGNDQVLVKGLSNLHVTVSSANKMVANKSATPKNYVMSIDTLSKTVVYSDNDLVASIGSVSSSGIKRLNVRAYDSRNNSTLAYKDVTVYDYAKPVINASITRLNNFENQTTIKINGTYTRLTINDTDKNVVTKVQYRYREAGGTWSSWVTLSTTINEGKYSCSDVILSLDNTKAFEFEIQTIDKLDSNSSNVSLDVGQAIFFISSNKKACYINGQEILTYDVVDEW